MPDDSEIAGTSPVARYRSVRGRVEGYRREAHEFRRRADVRLSFALALGMAALTGLSAQVAIPLPFTPVPITGQTFAVLLAGVALGARWGGVSQALYVGLGAVGVPWFQGMAGGLGAVAGATGGYLIGFVAAAVVVGWVVHRFAPARRFLPLVALLLAANFLVVYAFGLAWLAGWLALTTGAVPSLGRVLALGLLPFIVGDVVKVVAAAAVGAAIAPVETVDGTDWSDRLDRDGPNP